MRSPSSVDVQPHIPSGRSSRACTPTPRGRARVKSRIQTKNLQNIEKYSLSLCRVQSSHPRRHTRGTYATIATPRSVPDLAAVAPLLVELCELRLSLGAIELEPPHRRQPQRIVLLFHELGLEIRTIVDKILWHNLCVWRRPWCLWRRLLLHLYDLLPIFFHEVRWGR